jgi:hypothetical protein
MQAGAISTHFQEIAVVQVAKVEVLPTWNSSFSLGKLGESCAVILNFARDFQNLPKLAHLGQDR